LGGGDVTTRRWASQRGSPTRPCAPHVFFVRQREQKKGGGHFMVGARNPRAPFPTTHNGSPHPSPARMESTVCEMIRGPTHGPTARGRARALQRHGKAHGWVEAGGVYAGGTMQAAPKPPPQPCATSRPTRGKHTTAPPRAAHCAKTRLVTQGVDAQGGTVLRARRQGWETAVGAHGQGALHCWYVV
jgi:hypothetical protein